MATPVLGYGGSLGIGIESAWGTAVARTNWLHAYSLGLKRTVQHQEREHLGFANGLSMLRRSKFIAQDEAGGAIECPAAYNDSTALLLAHMFGKVADAGADPYTHTYTLGMPNDWPVGLTLEQIIGRLATGYKAEVFEGCVFTSAFIRQEYGQVLRIGGEVIAETSGGIVAAGTPTYHSGGETPILHHQCGNLVWNSLNDRVISWELTLDHARTRRMLLGSLHTQRPEPTNFPDVALRITREYDSDIPHAGHLAGTTADLTLAYAGGGDLALALTLENAYVAEYDAPVSGQGIVQQTLTFRPLADGDGSADGGLKLVLTNNAALYTAN